MTFSGNGNVWMWTSNPAAKLHVSEDDLWFIISRKTYTWLGQKVWMEFQQFLSTWDYIRTGWSIYSEAAHSYTAWS